jgi:hypothetical protein
MQPLFFRILLLACLTSNTTAELYKDSNKIYTIGCTSDVVP